MTGWACWGVEVIAKYGCGSLYVELTVLDSGGSVVGMTNDTASGMLADEHAKLTFNSPEDGAQKARMSEINCR